MKPFSNLNEILTDGCSFLYDMPWEGVQNVTISSHQVGDLILTSGKLLAWDLLMIPDDRYFVKKSLKPGRYPVVISVADFQPAGDTRIACATVLVGNGPTVSWELAAINNPDTETTEDINYYGVDSGTGSFMDVDSAKILAPLVWEQSGSDGQDKFEEFCDKVLAEMEKHSLGKYGGARWANMKVSASTETNVVTFSSGWGDGGYASFWGYDALGDLTCLVTDFALFNMS